MQDTHVTDLIPAYAVGSLEPDEVDAVERHLATCEQCRAEARQFARVGDELLLAAPQHDAPPALRDRILAQVRSIRADRAASDTPTPPQTPQPAPRSLNPLVRAFRAAFRPDEYEDEASDELRLLLLDPESDVFAVSGTPNAPAASARLIANPHFDRAVLVANGLAAPGPGRAYQVWFLRDGKPIPNVTFAVDRQGRGVSIVRVAGSFGSYDTVAVTPEPSGGSPSPTGPIVLAGALKPA